VLGNRKSLAAKGSSHVSSLRYKGAGVLWGVNNEEIPAMTARKVEFCSFRRASQIKWSGGDLADGPYFKHPLHLVFGNSRRTSDDRIHFDDHMQLFNNTTAIYKETSIFGSQSAVVSLLYNNLFLPAFPIVSSLLM
jgi:hypothetical protein